MSDEKDTSEPSSNYTSDESDSESRKINDSNNRKKTTPKKNGDKSISKTKSNGRKSYPNKDAQTLRLDLLLSSPSKPQIKQVLPSPAERRASEVRSTPNTNELDRTVQPLSAWKWPCLCLCVIFAFIGVAIAFSRSNSDTSATFSDNDNWRSKIDPSGVLSHHQRSIISASLKSILDKSSKKDEEGVSTLLILSPNEENAAKIARCLLQRVNIESEKSQISTEIYLPSHQGGKLRLDSNLKTLLQLGNSIRGVLLRRIDDDSLDDSFEYLRLLFAYCDGENPVIPNRLIIMTATSNSQNESELREKFKNLWTNEHDFIDALMSRISGHTLFIEQSQISIC